MSKYILAGGKHDEMGDSLKIGRVFRGEIIEGLNLIAGAGMVVKLQAGTGRIPTGSGLGSFFWPFLVDTAGGESITVGTADGTNKRIDSIVLYLIAANNNISATNNPTSLGLALVPGVPASSPTAPDDSAIQTFIGAGRPYIRPWDVGVPAGANDAASFTLTDRRVPLKLGIMAPYLDANGWTVYDRGTYKEWERNFDNSFSAVSINGQFSYAARTDVNLPVGVNNLEDVYYGLTGRTSNPNVIVTRLEPGSTTGKITIKGNNISAVSQSISSHNICVRLREKTGS